MVFYRILWKWIHGNSFLEGDRFAKTTLHVVRLILLSALTQEMSASTFQTCLQHGITKLMAIPGFNGKWSCLGSDVCALEPLNWDGLAGLLSFRFGFSHWQHFATCKNDLKLDSFDISACSRGTSTLIAYGTAIVRNRMRIKTKREKKIEGSSQFTQARLSWSCPS